MYEQNDTPSEQPVAQRRDAIEISDFVYGATGVRLRRLTMPDGTHWFPAVDVCKHLGYAHVGSALRNVADATNFDRAESVLQKHSLSIPAGREWRRDMNLVNLQGLIRLVNDCTKPESAPFDRVHDCVRMLIKRGCMRQAGVAAGGMPVYVLP
nr:Bro-N domain-containing protein [Streptomyces incarnatus]